MKVYIAAGWFTDDQEYHLNQILRTCKEAGIKFYSPRDHGKFILGKTPPEAVFAENIDKIKSADFVIASTTGKDMGTIFECGYAHAIDKPILYTWFGAEPDQKFNLMLSESGHQVVQTVPSLFKALEKAKKHGHLIKVKYEGHIE